MNERLNSARVGGRITGGLSAIPGISNLPSNAGIPDRLYSYQNDYPDGVDKPWEAGRLMYAGRRADQFTFFGYLQPDKTINVLAGCRMLTLEEARNHDWSDSPEDCVAFVDAIEAWGIGLIEAGTLPDAPPPSVPTAIVKEFLGERLFKMFQNWSQYEKATRVVG